MNDRTPCLLCEDRDATIKPIPTPGRGPWFPKLVTCHTCGQYAIEDGAERWLTENPDHRYCVSAIAREASVQDRPILFIDEDSTLTVGDAVRVRLKDASEQRFPRTIAERIDRTLLNLARMTTHLGEKVAHDCHRDRSVCFASNYGEASFVLDALVSASLLERGAGGPHSEHEMWVQITPKGWMRIEELQAGRVGGNFTLAFVAMWFGDNRDKFGGVPSAQFSYDTFMKGLKVGIEKAGYSARRIDFKEFNDDITDEIIAEMRRSRFVVADFTGHRSGVYYEAGFAKGLGLPVIFTCHKDDIDQAHFDTNHMNHLAWGAFEELADKLEKRIVATLGQGPLKPPQAANRPSTEG